MAADSDEPCAVYDEAYPMDELHSQQSDFMPLPQPQQSDSYTVLGETGEEHLPGGSFTFLTHGNSFIDQPMNCFGQDHILSVPPQFLSMFTGENPCVFGPHYGTIDSQNLVQQVEPLSWFGLSDEALTYTREWGLQTCSSIHGREASLSKRHKNSIKWPLTTNHINYYDIPSCSALQT
ncbi:hypothetical protein NW767_014384 [Fusarium falciforme]|nr:hypothetical protein NW767_014384 [Fusarium falciforme]